MKLIPLTAALVASLTFGAAQAMIVNLDATKGTGPFGNETDAATQTITFAPGDYTISVIDNSAHGGYAGWTYAFGSGYREAFDISAYGVTVSIDVPSSTNRFTSYSSTADALSAFASGLYVGYLPTSNGFGTAYDGIFVGFIPDLGFNFTETTTVTFGIPDNLFGDNTGGVSLAITQAVPEPETYALMLAGLGAIGFIGRRRKAV